MREHRYSLEMPHSADRLWALFQEWLTEHPEYHPDLVQVTEASA